MLHESFEEGARPEGATNIKATNHGLIFDIKGRRILTVFDTKTCEKIYNYDEIFTKTRSKEKARAAVKPFTARLMVESNTAVPPRIPMTQEQKDALAEWRKKHPRSKSAKATRAGRRDLFFWLLTMLWGEDISV